MCLNAVSLRVLTVRIHDNTGKSGFATARFHDVVNLGTCLFPNLGSHWDPGVSGPLTAFAAAIVTIARGPRALAGRGRA